MIESANMIDPANVIDPANEIDPAKSKARPDPDATTPAISLDDVELRLGGHLVLDRVALEVRQGDFLAVIGPNGGGKSSLLRVILGLLRPSRGRVEVLGKSPRKARGRVGYVPQYASFDRGFPIRVADVVRMGRLGHDGLFARPGQSEDAVRAALARVDSLALADRPIGALSGGQLQRVLIARALAVAPDILLLDEPTASLDVQSADAFYGLLEEFSKTMTVVLVSHDVGGITRRVRSIACLNRRLHAHPSGALTAEMVEETYGCPIDLLAHGTPHRVLAAHPSTAPPPLDHGHQHGPDSASSDGDAGTNEQPGDGADPAPAEGSP